MGYLRVVVEARAYRHVGPAGVLAAVRDVSAGRVARTREDLVAWMRTVSPDEVAEPFTFIIDVQGDLRLALRRSEHVAIDGLLSRDQFLACC